jgi:F-type H+-transporting ATPase subunit epsilon
MAEQLQLEVVTPERRLLSEPVNSVTVPARGGELGILPGHAPLISELQSGVLSYNEDGTVFKLLVAGGFVEVNKDRVSVLAQIAERPEEIDVARARKGKEIAETRLSGRSDIDVDVDRAQAKLMRNLHRIELAASSITSR